MAEGETSRFGRAWAALTEPSPAITDFGERRRAQFLAGLLAIILPLSFLGLGQRVVGDVFTFLDIMVSLVGLVLVSVAYGLSRTRWVRLAAWICVGAAASASYAVLITSEIGAVQIAFMGMAVWLAGMLLPVRDTIVLAALEILAVGLLPVIAPDRLIDHQAALSFVLFFGLAVILGVRHRDRLERDRKAELEHSEQRHRLHLQAAFEGLAVLRDQKLYEVNAGLGEILGVPAAELEGSSVFSYLDPGSHQAVRDALVADRAGPIEVKGRTADGTAISLEFTSLRSALPSDDTVFLAVRDVTEQHEMERKLAIAETVASLGTLAAGIGHEINNPLHYVVANLDFLDRELRPILPTLPAKRRQEIETCLTDAREGAKRVGAIVSDLRTLSGPSRPDDETTADIRSAIEMARRIAGHELRKARAELRLQMDDVPPVRASAAQLGQAFLNLIINACHALDPDTPQRFIDVHASKLTDTRVVIEVRDYGVGIPADDLKRVFDPFFTTKSTGRGSGLGLAIVHSMVTALGGDIQLTSEPGRGTTVRLELPVAAPKAKPPVDHALPSPEEVREMER